MFFNRRNPLQRLKTESFKTALTHDPDIKDDFEMEDDASLAYHFMIMNYGGTDIPIMWIYLIRIGTGSMFQRELADLLSGNCF